MEWRIEYLEESGVVLVEYHGKADLEGVDTSTRQGDGLARWHGARGVLVDLTDLEVNMPAHQIFGIPEIYKQMDLPMQRRTAFLIHNERGQIKDYEFFENVCVNRGYHFRGFSTREDALQWLKE
jgi:hypothetical protein